LFLPTALSYFATYGVVRTLGYPSPEDPPLPTWANRVYRAHMNLVENIGPFAILVIVAWLVHGGSNPAVALGAMIFFWARVVQAIVHMAGIPYVRTLAFFTGVGAEIYILLQILGAG
jgi:uncharacterized MAPEG superfamily protein